MKTPNFITVLSGAALATSGVFGLCLPSSAAQLWNWNYYGGGSQGGSGTFITDDGPGPYVITGITGFAEGAAIVSLYPPNTFSNDNLLFTSFSQLSSRGVLFSLSEALSVRVFSLFGPYAQCNNQVLATNNQVLGCVIPTYRLALFNPLVDPSDVMILSPIFFTATLANEPPTTPEPSLLLGFITLGGLMCLWRCSRS